MGKGGYKGTPLKKDYLLMRSLKVAAVFMVAFLLSMRRRLFPVLTFQTRFEDRRSYFCPGFDFSEKEPNHDD